MISADTNLFVYAADPNAPNYYTATQFFAEHAKNSYFVLSELVLIEIYMVLRNQKVLQPPFTAKEATRYCQALANNPVWQRAGLPSEIMDDLWKRAQQDNFAFRRLIDLRLGLSLRWHGVTEFATANVKDFQECGFTKVWNPCLPTKQ